MDRATQQNGCRGRGVLPRRARDVSLDFCWAPPCTSVKTCGQRAMSLIVQQNVKIFLDEGIACLKVADKERGGLQGSDCTNPFLQP
eukprot:1157775-Pelagomonas_calceolata.AAC.21